MPNPVIVYFVTIFGITNYFFCYYFFMGIK
jgi:hypothetical protein